MTLPVLQDDIIFGNDYLLTFGDFDKLTAKKRLHESMIEAGLEKASVSGYHTHVAETDQFITPTDICTLMRYERFLDIRYYFIPSRKYFSLWNCMNNELEILPIELVKAYLEREKQQNDKKQKLFDEH